MNKKWIKSTIAASLAISMALSGAAAVSAKGDHDRGKGNDKKHGKGHGKGKGKASFELKLDGLKLEFKDVDMEWARQHIASLVAQGVFEGYEDGTFQPNKKVTRLEALVTAVRLMDLREEAESDEMKSAHLHLKDEDKIADWARGYVAVALEQDLFFENADKLQPEKPADRLWVTTLLVKALGLEEEARARMTTKLTFKDAHEIPAGSVGYVALAVEKGIVKGYDNNTFRPNNPVTRAEIAAFLDRTGQHMDDYQLRGTLQSAVTNNKLVLVGGIQYEIDDDAYVFYQDDRIDLDDLQAGDQVSFITYNDIIIFIKLIDQAEDDDDDQDHDDVEQFQGTLVRVDEDDEELVIQRGSANYTYEIDDDAVIFRNGVRAELDDLKSGDVLLVRLDDDEITYVYVTKEVEDVPEIEHLSGIVSEDPEDDTIKVYVGSRLKQYELSDDADLYRNGALVDETLLRAGDSVSFRIEDGLVEFLVVTSTVEQGTFLNGTITEELDAQHEIEILVNGTERDYDVADQALIYRNDVKVDADDLRVGDEVFVRVENGDLTYIQVTKRVEQNAFTVRGELEDTDLDSSGKLATIKIRHTVNGNTQVSIYDVADQVAIIGAVADLDPGQEIELKGTSRTVTQIRIL